MALDTDRVIEQMASLRFVDDPRNRQYLTHLDAMLDKYLAMPAGCWKDPANRHRWKDMRSYGSLGAAAAFLYALPLSRHYANRHVLELFTEILIHCLDQQNDLGALTDVSFPLHTDSAHGQAWNLENLLYGLIWAGKAIDLKLFERANRACYRCANLIASNPILEINNRGVIACAAMALCGKYFREQRFIDHAIHWFHQEPVRVFDRHSGQIMEGSAPDGNYSGTSFVYLYLYRIMSGDAGIDRDMIQALKWFSRVLTPRGDLLLMGAATRIPLGSSAVKIHDILPALEHYSTQEPFFSSLIDQYLPLMVERGQLGATCHIASPTIWALMEHEPTKATSTPSWYTDMKAWCRSEKLGPEHFGYNEGYDSLYFPIRRSYTTSVGFRSRSPFKDLQAWAMDHEPPVVFPHYQFASKTTAWGLDTAAMNISGIKIPLFCWIREDDAYGLIGQWDNYWRYYVLTPRTTLLLGAGNVGATRTRWVIDPAICGLPILEQTTIRYEGREGRLHLPIAPTQIRTERKVKLFDFDFPDSSAWFAFGDSSFRMRSHELGKVIFTDADGRWEVQYRLKHGGPDLKEKLANFPHNGQKYLTIRRLTRRI